MPLQQVYSAGDLCVVTDCNAIQHIGKLGRVVTHGRQVEVDIGEAKPVKLNRNELRLVSLEGTLGCSEGRTKSGASGVDKLTLGHGTAGNTASECVPLPARAEVSTSCRPGPMHGAMDSLRNSESNFVTKTLELRRAQPGQPEEGASCVVPSSTPHRVQGSSHRRNNTLNERGQQPNSPDENNNRRPSTRGHNGGNGPSAVEAPAERRGRQRASGESLPAERRTQRPPAGEAIPAEVSPPFALRTSASRSPFPQDLLPHVRPCDPSPTPDGSPAAATHQTPPAAGPASTTAGVIETELGGGRRRPSVGVALGAGAGAGAAVTDAAAAAAAEVRAAASVGAPRLSAYGAAMVMVEPSFERRDFGQRAVSALTEMRARERERLAAMAWKWSQARRKRDYTSADALRSELRSAGYEPEELLVPASSRP